MCVGVCVPKFLCMEVCVCTLRSCRFVCVEGSCLCVSLPVSRTYAPTIASPIHGDRLLPLWLGLCVYCVYCLVSLDFQVVVRERNNAGFENNVVC
jgi:hypothetical protein